MLVKLKLQSEFLSLSKSVVVVQGAAKRKKKVPGSVFSGFRRLGLVSRSAGVVKVRVACV